MVEGYLEMDAANIDFDELANKKKDKQIANRKKKRKQSRENHHNAASPKRPDSISKLTVPAKKKKKTTISKSQNVKPTKQSLEATKKEDAISKKKYKKSKPDTSSSSLSAASSTKAASTTQPTTASHSSNKPEPRKKEELTPQVKLIKTRCKELKDVMEKFYKTVVKEVHALTDQHLPKKKKKQEMMRVCIKIPPSKKPGDNLTFTNPAVAGQRTVALHVPSRGKVFHKTTYRESYFVY